MKKRDNKPVVFRDKPVFQYTSKCCSAPATKTPCLKSQDAEATLGTWRCTQCRKKCAVNRHKVPE
jgi:hypothetical protein